MLDHLIEVNGLWPQFEQYGLTTNDIVFIKELIAGPLKDSTPTNSKWKYHGRKMDKSFLYEVSKFP